MGEEIKILHLTLKKKWFDLISSGAKKEEYREIKPYWTRWLEKDYTHIEFRNGYGKHVPSVTVELKEILIGLGVVEHGAPMEEAVYILKLGDVIEEINIKAVAW